MNVAVNEALGGDDRLMLVSSGGLPVAFQFVGDQHLCFQIDVGYKGAFESVGLEVFDDQFSELTTSFLHTDYDVLARCSSTTLSSAVGIVYLNDTGELVLEVITRFHALSDLHCHSPGSLVGDPKSSLKLFGADSLLGLNHQPDGDIPLLKWSPRAMEDRSCSDRELIGALPAAPDLAGRDPVEVIGTALGTSNAVGPAYLAEEDLALVLGSEPFLKLQDVHANLLCKDYSTNWSVCQGDKGYILCCYLMRPTATKHRGIAGLLTPTIGGRSRGPRSDA